MRLVPLVPPVLFLQLETILRLMLAHGERYRLARVSEAIQGGDDMTFLVHGGKVTKYF